MARRINLVPTSERVRTTTNVGMLAFVVGAIIVVAGLGLGYYQLNNTLRDRKEQLVTYTQQTQELQTQVAGLRQYGELDTQRKKIEGVVQGAYAGRTLVADILDSISLVLPDNVWFATLNLATTDPGLKAGGTTSAGNSLTITGDTYTFEDVAQLLVRLQLVRGLADVKLTSAGDPVGIVDLTKGVKGFAIKATVENTQPGDSPLPVSQVAVEGP